MPIFFIWKAITPIAVTDINDISSTELSLKRSNKAIRGFIGCSLSEASTKYLARMSPAVKVRTKAKR